MKTRNGFVSNSSSSSFVLITSKETMAKVANELSIPERKFLKSIIGSQKNISLDGKKKILYNDTYYTEMIYENYEAHMASEQQEKEVNGCDHKFDRKKMKFCPECGQPRTKIIMVEDFEEDFEDDGMDLFEKIMKKFKKYEDSYASVEPF